jgi:CheY-like chemotaxis protein
MRTILLADDREASRELLETVLSAEQYDVVAVEDGQAALEWAETSVADLAILDLHMPRRDGYAVLAALRERTPWTNIPILAITASAMETDKQRALEAGFTEFMAKPINLAQLRRTVRRLLEA